MRRIRRIVVLAAAVGLTVVVAYTGLWYQTAYQVRRGLDAWAAARRAEGYRIEYAGPTVTGFPLRIRIRLDNLVIGGPGERWQWAEEGVVADARPWAFRRVVVRPLGPLSADYVTPTGRGQAEFSPSEPRLVLRVDERGRLERAVFDADRYTLNWSSGPGPLTGDDLHIDARLLPAPPAPAAPGANPSAPPSAEIALATRNLNLPKAVAGPLGPQLQWLTAEATLTGALPPGSPAESLAAWRDSGGTVEVKSLDLAWGPLQLSGNATIALDPTMQPEGAGTAQIRGFGETIDALVAQGLVKPNDGAFAKAGLGLLARTPKDGGAKVLSVPLTIQRQTLFAGPLPLIHLPAITWTR
jgi:hypothetical protein